MIDNCIENRVILYYNKGWMDSLWKESSGQFDIPNGIELTAYELGKLHQKDGRFILDSDVISEIIKK